MSSNLAPTLNDLDAFHDFDNVNNNNNNTANNMSQTEITACKQKRTARFVELPELVLSILQMLDPFGSDITRASLVCRTFHEQHQLLLKITEHLEIRSECAKLKFDSLRSRLMQFSNVTSITLFKFDSQQTNLLLDVLVRLFPNLKRLHLLFVNLKHEWYRIPAEFAQLQEFACWFCTFNNRPRNFNDATVFPLLLQHPSSLKVLDMSFSLFSFRTTPEEMQDMRDAFHWINAVNLPFHNSNSSLGWSESLLDPHEVDCGIKASTEFIRTHFRQDFESSYFWYRIIYSLLAYQQTDPFLPSYPTAQVAAALIRSALQMGDVTFGTRGGSPSSDDDDDNDNNKGEHTPLNGGSHPTTRKVNQFVKANAKRLLFAAVRGNVPAAIKVLLDSGLVDANCEADDDDDDDDPDRPGNSPFHEAMLNKTFRAPETVQLLLEHGADANKKNKRGETPLHVASDPINKSYLLKQLSHLVSLTQVDNRLETPLHRIIKDDCSWEIFQLFCDLAIKRNELSTILIPSRDIDGNTPLHLLCMRRSQQSGATSTQFDYLIQNGADINAKNNKGKTPFDFFVEKNSMQHELLDLLVNNGARLGAANPRVVNEYLHKQIQATKTGRQHGDVAKLLAIFAESPSCLDVNSSQNSYGCTLLHTATRCMDLAIAQVLIDACHADVNARDGKGQTPLFQAMPNLEMVTFLLSRGADPNATDHEGNTPCHMVLGITRVTRKFVADLIGLMVERGANLHIPNAEGVTVGEWCELKQLRIISS